MLLDLSTQIELQKKALSISGPLAALRTHQLRASVDGILISSKTAHFDWPSLTTRKWFGQNPTPIVIVGQAFAIDLDWLSNLEVKPILIGEQLPEGFSGIECNLKDLSQWVPQLLGLGEPCFSRRRCQDSTIIH